MSEPTPVTEDGEVIGLPPNRPPEDQTVCITPELPIVESPPSPPVGLVAEEDL